MKVIIGLGNVGDKYTSTKHNIGFLVLDAFAKQNNITFKKERKFKGEVAKYKDTILLKPHTFMNLSGESLQPVLNFYNIEIEDILVIYDDLDLPFTKIRLRETGSSGGHNGIKSIISHIRTQEFKRLKIGIDKNPLYETKDYVLSKLTKKELEKLDQLYNYTNNLIEDFVSNKDFIDIMNTYNNKIIDE